MFQVLLSSPLVVVGECDFPQYRQGFRAIGGGEVNSYGILVGLISSRHFLTLLGSQRSHFFILLGRFRTQAFLPKKNGGWRFRGGGGGCTLYS